MPFVCSPSGLRELLFGGIFVSTRRASISFPIVAQSHELWVPKTTLGRPFQRLNRRDRFKARSNGKHAAGKIALGNQAAAQQDMTLRVTVSGTRPDLKSYFLCSNDVENFFLGKFLYYVGPRRVA